ncbi:MAG: hypothetical protein AAF399_10095 [Bacteroidota bacterium]
MKLLLLLNTVAVLGLGVIMVFVPAIFWPDIAAAGDARDLAYGLARNFGFASLSIAALSGLMAMRPITPEVRFVGMGTLAAFHLGLTIAHLFNVFDGLTSLVVVAIHGAFALIFLVMFLWQVKR